MTSQEPFLEVLIDSARIAERVAQLGAQISAEYKGRPLHLIGILKGSWVFMADLIRHLDLPLTVDFLGFSSYGDEQSSSGQVKITKDLDSSIEGVDVLVVEDILDTGHTFHYLNSVLARRKPRSMKVVTLLDKPSRRVNPVTPDFLGFTIPDAFVVGYGLDYAQRYRELPDVCILHLAPGEKAKVREPGPG
ncbi:MAG TPA: hypoxanthine phosphoribosyltransferase [Terriglobia bacterium]|nr:hypoxanthine phosphoribosyltransferase [Terriglobia bacterium]